MPDSKIDVDVLDRARTADEENGNFERSWREEKWGDARLSEVAGHGAKEQGEMTVREAIKYFRPGLAWCLVRRPYSGPTS